MGLWSKISDLFRSKEASTTQGKEAPNFISITSMEIKYENEDYIGAARELKTLLEAYGRRKSKNHRYKGRVFISFILSNKHQDLKNVGYTHYENLIDFIKLNHVKVYPYHKNNLRNAMTFFEKEVKGLYDIKIPNNQL